MADSLLAGVQSSVGSGPLLSRITLVAASNPSGDAHQLPPDVDIIVLKGSLQVGRIGCLLPAYVHDSAYKLTGGPCCTQAHTADTMPNQLQARRSKQSAAELFRQADVHLQWKTVQKTVRIPACSCGVCELAPALLAPQYCVLL